MKKLTLCRSKNAKLFGVFGGIAEYLELDPSVIRLIGLVFILFAGGLLAYLAAALILPSHPEEGND